MIWRKQLASDGRRFVGWVGDDFGAGEVVEGDAATETIERRFPVQGVQSVDLAFRDGDRTIEVVLGNRQGAMAVATWDLSTGTETRRALAGPGPSCTRPVAYSPDGRTWAYLDKTRDAIQLWDVATDQPRGGPLRTPTSRRDLVHWAWTAATFTPDGRTLIVGRADGQVEFWSVAEGRVDRIVRLHPVGVTPMHLIVLPDGRTLASNGTNLASRSWLVDAWREASFWLTGKNAPDWSVETVLADAATGQVRARASRCQTVALSPDGRTVVTWAHDGRCAFRPFPPTSPVPEDRR